MKDRHWDRLQNILSTTLDVESPAFLLGDVMKAPLLPNKDDIEDVCVGANKEKDIEAKLKQVIAEWSIVNLQLAMFKGRELLIKAQEAMEIVGLLDDNIMILNSLATNRYFKNKYLNYLIFGKKNQFYLDLDLMLHSKKRFYFGYGN